MTFSQSYCDFIQEQLAAILPDLNLRAMFGGVGFYSHGLFFALIAEDVLYFYASEASQADYLARDMQRFGRHYFEVPIDIVEDPEALSVWAQRALTDSAARPGTRRRPRA